MTGCDILMDYEFIGFDSDEGQEHEFRLKREFYYVMDPTLRAAYLENALYWWDQKHYRTIVTCVKRTREENNLIGGYSKSGHLPRQVNDGSEIVYALDTRTRNMSGSLRQSYQGRLESIWNGLLYVLYHSNHLHSGVPRFHQVGEIV